MFSKDMHVFVHLWGKDSCINIFTAISTPGGCTYATYEVIIGGGCVCVYNTYIWPRYMAYIHAYGISITKLCMHVSFSTSTAGVRRCRLGSLSKSVRQGHVEWGIVSVLPCYHDCHPFALQKPLSDQLYDPRDPLYKLLTLNHCTTLRRTSSMRVRSSVITFFI
jgi:hypothetical protein